VQNCARARGNASAASSTQQLPLRKHHMMSMPFHVTEHNTHTSIARELHHNESGILWSGDYNRNCVIFTTFDHVFATHDYNNFTSAITHSLKWRQFLAVRKNGPAPRVGPVRLPFSTKPNETERLLCYKNVSNSNISISLFHTYALTPVDGNWCCCQLLYKQQSFNKRTVLMHHGLITAVRLS